MVRLVLDLKKSIEENASDYFEKAKKMKKKISGAKEALQKNLKKLNDLEKKKEKFQIKEEKHAQIKQRNK